MTAAEREAQYARAIAARRAFALPGYATLADVGMEGAYVSPIQLTSGNLAGPMLISKDWLDAPSAQANAARLRQTGYLPEIPFNRVLDGALAQLGLTRGDVYISPIFQLLPDRRSSQIPAVHARASFQAVVRHEIMGRRPVALGQDSARTLRHFGVPHEVAPHPSAPIGTFAQKAEAIAAAIMRAHPGLPGNPTPARQGAAA